jgi:predicted esterase YcpF (UPF0227 family)
MLYYIHGYLSSPNSTKATLFKKTLNAKPIKYRDCPPEELIISDCIKRIKDEIKNNEDTILIGSSLGGFLAAKTALMYTVKKIIILNPAIIPIGYDLKKIKDMPYEIIKDMQDESLFKEKITSEITIFIGTNDDVVPNLWPLEFAKAQEAKIHFLHDDHSLTRYLNQLPSLIKNII